MFVYRDFRFILNPKAPNLKSIGRLFIQKSNDILNGDYCKYSTVDNARTTNSNTIDQPPLTKNSKENRLNELRNKLNNEDHLKQFKDYLNLNNDQNDKSNAIIAKRKQRIPYLPEDFLDGNEETVYIETYGCMTYLVLVFFIAFINRLFFI